MLNEARRKVCPRCAHVGLTQTDLIMYSGQRTDGERCGGSYLVWRCESCTTELFEERDSGLLTRQQFDEWQKVRDTVVPTATIHR